MRTNINQTAHLEIHFYSEYEAAVIFETFAQNDERKAVEIQAFNSFTLRHLDNLQVGGIPLARIFASIEGDISSCMSYFRVLLELNKPEELAIYIPLLAALGVDLSAVVKFTPAFSLLRVSSGNDTMEIARTLWPNIAKVVSYRGVTAGKRFIADFEWKGKKVFLKLEQKGFGLFGKGINYYAPMSVALLLKYLTDKHQDDWPYQKHIQKSAQFCGQVLLNGKMNSLNQLDFPVQIEQLTLQ